MGYINCKGENVPNYVDLYGEFPYEYAGSCLTPEQQEKCKTMSLKERVAYKEAIMKKRHEDYLKGF